MRILLDTSVLVAAMVETHPFHARALVWLKRASEADVEAFVAVHTLLELYSVLTRFPVQPAISPTAAHQLILENVLPVFELFAPTDNDYQALLEYLSKQGIAGGAAYDALIAYAASKIEVDHLITFNERDFKAVYPGLSNQIVVP